MKIKKIAVVLEEADLVDLETILLDEDEPAAFKSLKRLNQRIEVQQR